MFSRLFLALGLTFCLCAPATQAQESGAPRRAAPDEWGTMFRRGFYDELLSRVERKLAEPSGAGASAGAGDKAALLYWRGLSRYKLGWLAEAQPDLEAAQAAGLRFLPGGFGVRGALDSLQSKMAAMPPNLHEVREGERVLFRMHYFNMEDGAATVLGMLPDAYRISRQMFGSDVEATSVYVFDSYPQFVTFYKLYSGGKAPGSWVGAVTVGDVVMISLRAPDGKLRARDGRAAFVNTIVHEFNHAMFNRLMGTSLQPRWFKEGLAQIAGGETDADYVATKERLLRRLFVNHALISARALEDYGAFNEQTEAGLALQKAGRADAAPDPYTQSWGIARYFLAHISTAQLQSFLNRARESADFNGAFRDEFGMSVAQFYEMWKSEVGAQLSTAK